MTSLNVSEFASGSRNSNDEPMVELESAMEAQFPRGIYYKNVWIIAGRRRRDKKN